MHENPKLTIAIDGPSGSGKSSVSKEVARHFGLAYLDTGAMYRAATYRVLELGIDLNDAEAIAKAVEEMPLVFGTNIKEEEILMGSTDIREEIRSERISCSDFACAAGDELTVGFASAGHSAVCAVPGRSGPARYGAYRGVGPDAVGADFCGERRPNREDPLRGAR